MGLFASRGSKARLAAWILVHLAIVLATLAFRPIAVETDLLSVLPDTDPSRSVAAAERVLSERSGAGMFILAEHADFSAAREAALRLAAALEPLTQSVDIECRIDSTRYRAYADYLFEQRYLMPGKATLQALRSGDASRVAAAALEKAYGAFTFSSLDRLDEDPFLLGESSMASYLESALLSGVALGLKDEVLSAELGGMHYVLLRLAVRGDGMSLGSGADAVEAILGEQSRLEAAVSGLRWIDSGVPFHSYESARNAKREITLIFAISSALIVALLFYAYRSLLPLAATLAGIGIAMIVSLAATLGAFGSIHLLTIALGTSLIGMSIDYALHFFTERQNPHEPGDGESVRARVLPGIRKGLGTTLLCYVLLLFAPFPLLQQMAFFCMVGLVSMYSTVAVAFPLLGPASERQRRLPLAPGLVLEAVGARVSRVRRRTRVLLALGLIALAVPGLARLRFDNDIRGLYSMSAHLLESESLAAKVLDHGSAGWFFILNAPDEESLLQKEEALLARLDGEIEAGRLGSYLATSAFLPSLARQTEALRLVEANLLPLAETQFAALGFSESAAQSYRAAFRGQAERRLDPEAFLRGPFAEFAANLWLGEIEGERYSVVMPLHASEPDHFEAIAESMEGVHFLDKTRDISQTLAHMAVLRLWMLLVALVLIIGFLCFFHPPLAALRIAAMPVLASAMSLAVLGWLNFPLDLFSTIGIVLVLGLGIDYSIFLSERKRNPRITMLAVLLSTLTTLLSFGMLGLSSFAPLSTFGATVFFGISFSFLLAPFAARLPEPSRSAGEERLV